MPIIENNPVISKDDLIELGLTYQIEIDPENMTQYKLCQVVLMLESQLEEKEK